MLSQRINFASKMVPCSAFNSCGILAQLSSCSLIYHFILK
jgi:hypothetical protein